MSTNSRYVNWGPHEVPTSTDFGKELLRSERPENWDRRPHGANEFPKMMYKAYLVDGRVMCMKPPPKQFAYPLLEQFRMACEEVDYFNQSCQLTVPPQGYDASAGPEMQANAEKEGWRESPQEAADVLFDEQAKAAQLTAELAHQDRLMSDKAKAEAQKVHDAIPRHVVTIPEGGPKKIDKRTREYKEAQRVA